MFEQNGAIHFSATDLIGHLGCGHLTVLDVDVAKGARPEPKFWDPLLQILRERGTQHEASYIEHLLSEGFEITEIEGAGVEPNQADETLNAMRSGARIISQGVLLNDRWGGRADILRRVEKPSDLGEWSYEVIDTKLARETKGGTILQLCLYADLLFTAQGVMPESMYVIAPWSDFEPQVYRTSDFLAYYRLVKRSLEASVDGDTGGDTYPDPKQHCDICRWRAQCDARRREDDHLCLVAGASKLQINELHRHGIDTTSALAEEPIPLSWKPARGSAQTYERIREQARVQIEGRKKRKPVFETLESEPGYGLARLPEPSMGDIFFDLEGDPYVGEGGLEYLFGYTVFDEQYAEQYTGQWSQSREEEKQAFKDFVDFVIARWEEYPDLHIYHFAPYEPGALKRLMGRYATREEEIDRMLRAGLFVDLYGVVRGGIRASVESYSLKELEKFFGFERAIPLPDANQALAHVQACLESADIASLTDGSKDTVQKYNQDDCRSTRVLRDWLEQVRSRLIENGAQIDRPPNGEDDPSEAISEWQERIDALTESLTADVPIDIEERTDEQQARWILANTADWHRREEKSVWWEYFRLSNLSADDLVDERSAVSGLVFIDTVGGTERAPVHRYRFPAQETDLRDGKDLRSAGGDKFGKLEAISYEDLTVDIKKRMDSADRHPLAIFSHEIVHSKVLAKSLVGVGEFFAGNGLAGDGDHEAARDLLMKSPPRVGDATLRTEDETALEAALRITRNFQGGVLPIQGPPGSGKTFAGARMICALVDQGARVGITANSHKVIRNLLDEVRRAADESGTDLTAIQKLTEGEENQRRLQFTTDNSDVFNALGRTCQVAGGTAWIWARPEAQGAVDVLLVDEAAQMSLPNVLAVSQAARGLVLLGDPQQLEQPIQGSHPDGTAVSAFDHLLGEHMTIPADRGLFLEETWRLHPDICTFTSKMFYEGRLQSRPGLENQKIVSAGPIQGSGLRFLPVSHEGNQSSSPEEVAQILALVSSLVDQGATWINKDGVQLPLGLEDILIIAPYNAQVFELQSRLPGARIGTVDKFQGQEAALVIYSLATSTPEEAPHGMEFLYSLNRLNVATSRARCISLLVANPDIFEPECRTPRQMQLANSFCTYQEMADIVTL